MNNHDLLAYNIDLPKIIAGLAGGICAPLVMRNASPANVFTSVVVGGMCSNYMTEDVAKYFSVREGFAGFIVGVSALIIVQGILEAAKRFKSSVQKGSKNAD